jgi:regulator of protease activity HflC (stomatin/prohibitin superfamily)
MDITFIFEFFSTFLFIIVVIMFISYTVRVIPQSNSYVVERLGAYDRTLPRGLHFVFPIIDRVASKITLKEQVRDFAPQPVITKDNVTMMIDTVVYFQILDPKLYTYGVMNPINAIENLTATTLRNIIGDLELDQTLTSREIINSRMRIILDEATDPWGIKVNRVEVKNIIPPKDIQDAMEKQMRAERDRRSTILLAEGEKRSAVLKAEGKREATITEAEGQAQAIERVYQAQANGIEMINKANPRNAFLTLKGLEALEKVADGQATKIIIPSDLQNLAGLLSSAKAIMDDEPSKTK